MTTKAADQYADIAQRMKEIGCTSDAPVAEPAPIVPGPVDWTITTCEIRAIELLAGQGVMGPPVIG